MRTALLLLATAAIGALAPPHLARAELAVSLDYVDLESPQYERFRDWVDGAVGGIPYYAFSATDAVTMYRLTGGAQYAAKAIAMVDAQVADAETAIAADQPPEIAGDSYLEVGPMLRDLAMVYAFCEVPLATRTRWETYADQAVWNVWNHADAAWGGNPFPWTGWSVENPGNNYHFSFLEATMHWALAADRQEWIDFLVTEKLPPLVAYWQQLAGGGSREGTGYGVALMRLFEIYRVWRDSTGTNLAAQSPHLADTLDYWLHATVPTLDRYAPIGDLSRESYPNLFDYHRVLVLQALAMASGSPQAARASGWLTTMTIPPSAQGAMTQGFNYRHDLLTALAPPPAAPATRLHHSAGTGHLFARSSWSPTATWMSFVAGRYDESHAHEDQGAFNLFRGDWLAVSENVWSHSGIREEVVMHNTLRFVDGGVTVPQLEGSESTMAVSEVDGDVHVVADLAAAYAASGKVTAWTRTLDLDTLGLTVHDVYATSGGVAAVFQVQAPVLPVVSGSEVVAGDLRIQVLEPAAPSISIVDWSTVEPGELNAGYRVDVGGGSGEYRVRLELATGLFADSFERGDATRWSATGD